uniref:Uncharacterized protein n=1 Tax=Scleropages formosus TaxID=113540 RepID=A0A8C9VKS4_SCLFO
HSWGGVSFRSLLSTSLMKKGAQTQLLLTLQISQPMETSGVQMQFAPPVEAPATVPNSHRGKFPPSPCEVCGLGLTLGSAAPSATFHTLIFNCQCKCITAAITYAACFASLGAFCIILGLALSTQMEGQMEGDYTKKVNRKLIHADSLSELSSQGSSEVSQRNGFRQHAAPSSAIIYRVPSLGISGSMEVRSEPTTGGAFPHEELQLYEF